MRGRVSPAFTDLRQRRRALADRGLAVLLVEQFAALALAVGDRACVPRRGRMVFEGRCAELRGDGDRLHRLYLGTATA